MKALLEFDDAGATDDEPVKGVTVGDIRAWYDHIEALEAALRRIDAINDSPVRFSKDIHDVCCAALAPEQVK